MEPQPGEDTHFRVGKHVRIPLAEVDLRVSRSSGPGGQHANKTESRVEAVFDVAASESLTATQRERLMRKLGPVVRAVAQDERSQQRNRELALERLAERIDEGLAVPKRRVATRPSKGAAERRLIGKRVRATVKAKRRRPNLDD